MCNRETNSQAAQLAGPTSIVKVPSQKLRHILLLLLAIYFLFFFRIGARDLWTPDEPRYAQVAREMLHSGDWVVPHLNDEVYPEKPPLYFWLVAVFSKPFGDVTETTARLPSAVSAAILVLLTYWLGLRMTGEREGFWGALILTTSVQFVWVGRMGVLDALLSLCIVAALAAFYAGYAGKRAWLYFLGFVFLVPAVLTKGPVGIAAPVVVMVVFLLVELHLRKEGAGGELAWFGAAAVIGLAITGLAIGPWWHAAFERSGGDYGSSAILLKQTLGRMFESYSHRQPFYYYFVETLWQFLPWTAFVPLALWSLRRNGNLRERLGLRFLVVWFLSVFVFFSLVSGKRSQYILPLFPAGALLMGWAFNSEKPEEGQLRERRKFAVPLLLLVLAAGGGLIALVAAAYLYFRDFLWMTAAGVFFAALIVPMLVMFLHRKPPRTALACVAVLTILTGTVFFGYLAPLIDSHKSARSFCNTVLSAVDENDPLYFVGMYRPNIHFYMRRSMPRLDTLTEVTDLLEEIDEVFLVLSFRKRDMLDFGPTFRIKEVAHARVGSRHVLCVSVRRM